MSLFILLPVLVLSVIHQKQLRYLQGVMPFLIVLAVAGAWSFWRSGQRQLVAVLAVSSLLLGLAGLTFLNKKSMAAVVAAQQLAKSPAPADSICLSQAWAYGTTIYLGTRASSIRGLPSPLTGAALEDVLEECSVVALYREDYRRDPRIAELLRQYGFTASGRYEWGHSKPALVFRRSRRGS